jgi:hypothetical protein
MRSNDGAFWVGTMDDATAKEQSDTACSFELHQGMEKGLLVVIANSISLEGKERCRVPQYLVCLGRRGGGEDFQ